MKYLAHINHKNNNEQTLFNHLQGTAKKAAAFAAAFNDENYGQLAGFYHDIGKYSEEFQNYLRNGGGKKVDHSTAGMNLIMNSKNKDYVPIGFVIASHHTGLLNCGSNTDTSSETTFYGRMKRKMKADFPDFSAYEKEIDKPLKDIKSEIITNIKTQFQVQFYIRMLYSCLVDADFLDTENFMPNNSVIRGKYPSMLELKRLFDNYINEHFFIGKKVSEINKKRSEILNECIEMGKNSDESIFGLTVPTGGGKTMSSMAFALNHAIKFNKKRVIYVIPYTSIIEQNAKVFRDIFGEEFVVEHHSNISYDLYENTNLKEYEILKKSQLATENWDAPIIVTTNVQFFESLYAHKSSKCRKLHNIANSVVIFDEIQMLPTGNILPCINAMLELVTLYKMTAVLCTATQPSLEKIIYTISKQKVTEICSNIKENYKFFKRNKIVILDKKIKINVMVNNINNDKQSLSIINSKKAAVKLFKTLSAEENVFYLSTNLCAKHRIQTLNKIKQLLKDNEPCRVISTSLIEAGVDIDFPKVYRELTGLDSIIQSAGRCNREGKFDKNDSIVYVFEWEDRELEYKGHDLRPRLDAVKYALEKNYETIDSLEAIQSYFDYLHKFDGGGLDKNNIMQLIKDKPCNFIDFDKAFVMIEDATVPIFIPFDEKGEDILNELKSGNITREIMRKTGPYLVNVYKNKFNQMLEAHHIEFAEDTETLAYLCDEKYYDENLGLVQNVEEGESIFL